MGSIHRTRGKRNSKTSEKTVARNSFEKWCRLGKIYTSFKHNLKNSKHCAKGWATKTEVLAYDKSNLIYDLYRRGDSNVFQQRWGTGLLICLNEPLQPWEHWPRKVVWGCVALKTPFSRLSCSLQGRVPFQAKESVHKTPFWENLEILASTASIFAQILALKPPNWEIFSSPVPKF